jgi:predicted AAA+ superfamily ATPase
LQVAAEYSTLIVSHNWEYGCKKMIIGRKSEQNILTDIFNSKKAEFVAVYGRRRVGKTYLIEQFFLKKSCLYFSMTGLHKGTLKEQLSIFTTALHETFFSGLQMNLESPKNWMRAFEILTDMMIKFSKQKKIVLFFDELPWLASKKSGFKKALDHYWNTKWSKNNKVILIICGSAASWIINNIINDTGGLHNRITMELPIYPFSLKETNDYLNYLGCKFNQKQTLELYMALGGIPHYLGKVKPTLSAAQNISQLCFFKSSPLLKEFDKLFASLFENPDAYVDLIKIIAKKRYGIARTKIENSTKFETGGTLTNRLTALEQAGFIKSFMPIGYTEKGLYYKLIDEYCFFYLTWIFPIWRQIENKVDPGYWLSKQNTPAWHNWTGYAFESISLKHIAQIKKALFIPPGALAGSWYHQSDGTDKSEGAQIDLLFDRNDGVITICEIKYYQGVFEINKAIATGLQRKVRVFKEQSKTNKQIFLSIITSDALKKNRYSEELITTKATLSDLFQ